MLKNLDITFGILAWTCVPLISWTPAVLLEKNRSILLIVWAICICGALIFRRRPWRELWGAWLSAVVLWDQSTFYLFIAWALIFLIWAIAKTNWKTVIKLENMDYVLCFIAWVCALASRLVSDLPLPGEQLDYELYYLPAIWLLCICCLPLVRKHPWRELWWVFLSGPIAFLFWAILLYLIIVGARLN
jgi:hypothetical protein